MTSGAIDMTGCQPGNPDLNSAGPLAKTTIDVLNLANVLVKPGRPFIQASDLPSTWTGLKVGFVEPREWQPADFVTKPNEGFTVQSIQEFEDAICRIEKEGARVVKGVPLKKLVPELDDLLAATLKDNLEDFFGLS